MVYITFFLFLHELHHAFFIMLVHLISWFRCIQNNFQQKMANNYAVQRIHLTWLCVERYGVGDLSTFHEALCHISMEKTWLDLIRCFRNWQKCVSYAWTSIQVAVKYDLDDYSTGRRKLLASCYWLRGQCSTIKWAWFDLKKAKTTHTFLKESNQSFAQRLHFKSITLSSLETAVIKLNPSALRCILTLATLNKTYEIIG